MLTGGRDHAYLLLVMSGLSRQKSVTCQPSDAIRYDAIRCDAIPPRLSTRHDSVRHELIQDEAKRQMSRSKVGALQFETSESRGNDSL